VAALAVLMRVSLRLWQETALVFGLGLAHGLGFAAAIAGYGMPPATRPPASSALIWAWKRANCWWR
jgi:hypothetical protein